MAEQNNQDNNIKEIRLEIENLKARYNESLKFFKIILSSITIIFLFVGVIITVLSISSKSEIENAINRMETRFDKLAGTTLLEAKLELFQDANALSGITNIIERAGENGYLLKDFYLKNVGNKTAERIKLKFYFENEILDISKQLGPNAFSSGAWDSNISTIKKFPFLYVYNYEISLRPNETWSLSSLFIQIDENIEFGSNIKCQLIIYYESSNPLIITFLLE